MNRKIAFRAWDVDRKIMHTDILGRSFGIVLSTMKLEDYEFSEMLSGKFNQFKVMQFTGLLDKNGVEIYEGDKLQCPPGVGAVVWCDGCFRISWNEHDDTTLHDTPITMMEVVGNMYENER